MKCEGCGKEEGTMFMNCAALGNTTWHKECMEKELEKVAKS